MKAKAHKVVFVWYGVLILFLLHTALNKNEPVPASLDFLYFAVPMMAVPVSVFIAIAGVIDSIRYKAWVYTCVHTGSIALILLLMKQIAS
ncbi:hypothetical protein [Aeromonas popoffii]|uniref:hypothetical protein n=1 Tax=Aeromonas TaxID=642 RepID=UPI0030D4E637